MKAALLSLALFGNQPMIPVSDHVPHLDVEALCKATAADDKANGIVLGQSVEMCMRDETSAQEQLTAAWQANSGPTRDRCEGEAVAGGFPSYVDLLTCMEMAGPLKSEASSTPLRGASRNRNSK
jgi:hypothetical protein